MKVTFLNSPATEAAIAACEGRIGRPIPSPYRAFLAKHNGGASRPASFVFVDDAGATSSSVSEFLGVSDDYESIETYLTVFGARIPSDLFPVANDPGGNLVLIGATGSRKNRVFFWDHENESEAGELPDDRNVFPIAETFDAFLDGLSEGDT